MAKKYSLHQQRETDRRVALLGLAVAEKNKDTTPCLSDEELASLVNGMISTTERQEYLNHLACCQACYQHWLELSTIVLLKEKERGKTTLFLRPQFFAWTGSFLAAAASVVLFLNISRETTPPVVQQSIQANVERKSMSTVDQNHFDQLKESSRDRSMSREATRAVEPSKNAENYKNTAPAVLTAPVAVMKMEKQDMDRHASRSLTAEPEKTGKVSRQAGRIFNKTESNMHQPEILIQVWLDALRHGCQNLQTNPLFWEKRYREGKEYMRLRNNEENQLVVKLLLLVEKLQREPGERTPLCKQLLRTINDGVEK